MPSKGIEVRLESYPDSVGRIGWLPRLSGSDDSVGGYR